MSKSEDKIATLLKQSGIQYIREKNFSDLKHGLFRYDFYLPDLEGGPAIIEFNGEQHYHYIKHFFRTEREWRKMQEHDRRKISYALANKIKIYIIPFWEINKITTARQIFQDKFLAKTRWKNDEELKNSPLSKKI